MPKATWNDAVLAEASADEGGLMPSCKQIGFVTVVAVFYLLRGGFAQAEAPPARTAGERAVEEYFAPIRSKCEQGDTAACRRIVARTFFATNDIELAAHARSLKKACRQSIWAACSADAMADLQMGTQPMEAAISAFQRGCTARDDFSCSMLAEAWFKGSKQKEGEELARKSCDELGGWPCVLVGDLLAKTGDLAGATVKMQKACDSGDPYTCYQLGMIYAEGSNGVPKSEERATDLYRRACDDHLGPACYNLAWQYLRGTGAQRDTQRANELVDRACTLGDPQACDYLGTLAMEKGSDPDVWRVLCERWGAQACYNYASNLAKAQGETAEVAERMIDAGQLGCRRGNQASCSALGHLAKDYILGCEKAENVRNSCAFAGFLYLKGVQLPPHFGANVEPQPERARLAFQASCAAGAQVACERARTPAH